MYATILLFLTFCRVLPETFFSKPKKMRFYAVFRSINIKVLGFFGIFLSLFQFVLQFCLYLCNITDS